MTLRICPWPFTVVFAILPFWSSLNLLDFCAWICVDSLPSLLWRLLKRPSALTVSFALKLELISLGPRRSCMRPKTRLWTWTATNPSFGQREWPFNFSGRTKLRAISNNFLKIQTSLQERYIFEPLDWETTRWVRKCSERNRNMMMNHVHVNCITVKKVNFMLATARCLVFGNMAHSNYDIIWTSWPQHKELWWWEDVGSRSRLQITCDLLVGMERRNEQPDSYSPCSHLYIGWLQTYPKTSSSPLDFVWPPALSILPLHLLPVLTPKLYSTLWGHVPLIPEEADGDPQFATESELSPTAGPRSQDDIARCKVHDVQIIIKNQELHLRILLKKYPYRCLPPGPFSRAFSDTKSR